MSHLFRLHNKSRFIQEESGTSLVEITLSTMGLFMLIFGILDCSRALYADHFVSHVAREATRYAIVRGSSWNNANCKTTSTSSCTATNTDVTNFVKSIAPPGIAPATLTVATTWPGTTPTGAACSSNGNDPGCVVNVQVSYSFNFVLPLLPKDSLVLSSSSSMIIAQ